MFQATWHLSSVPIGRGHVSTRNEVADVLSFQPVCSVILAQLPRILCKVVPCRVELTKHRGQQMSETSAQRDGFPLLTEGVRQDEGQEEANAVTIWLAAFKELSSSRSLIRF